MSGRSKRAMYFVLDGLLFLLACGCIVLFFVFFFRMEARTPGIAEYVASIAFVLAIFLRVPSLVHEAGHLLFGLLAGMKKAAFRINLILRKGDVAGATEMFPKNGAHTRGKFLCFALGGAAANVLLGGAMFALGFALPYHPTLFFLRLLAPFMVYEGLRALIPAQLAAGKTDGAVIGGLLRRKDEEEVALAVMRAQGILYKGTFQDVPQPLLFDTPVVREDLPAFHALLMLRAQMQLSLKEDGQAEETLKRLDDLSQYLSVEQQLEVRRYQRIFRGEFRQKKSPLFGVNELEKRLADQTN